MALLILLLALTKAIAAVPSVNLPINAQVPPVARISNAFDFVFSDSTFASGARSMTYALSNSTNWLYLDSPSRTLSGTPGPADVGPVAVNLVASDDTGSASMLVTLVVSANPGPGLGRPLENQLSTHGSSSAADSFTLSHSSPLSLSFLPDTFTTRLYIMLYAPITLLYLPGLLSILSVFRSRELRLSLLPQGSFPRRSE